MAAARPAAKALRRGVCQLRSIAPLGQSHGCRWPSSPRSTHCASSAASSVLKPRSAARAAATARPSCVPVPSPTCSGGAERISILAAGSLPCPQAELTQRGKSLGSGGQWPAGHTALGARRPQPQSRLGDHRADAAKLRLIGLAERKHAEMQSAGRADFYRQVGHGGMAISLPAAGLCRIGIASVQNPLGLVTLPA